MDFIGWCVSWRCGSSGPPLAISLFFFGFLMAISTYNSIDDYSVVTRDVFRSNILALARKYKQGAIYEFKKNDRNKIIRLTVPVCISGCESQVELEPCSLKIFPQKCAK